MGFSYRPLMIPKGSDNLSTLYLSLANVKLHLIIDPDQTENRYFTDRHKGYLQYLIHAIRKAKDSFLEIDMLLTSQVMR